jgi:hypothetical protein
MPAPQDGVPIYSAGSPDVPMTRFTRNGAQFINAVVDADMQAGSLSMTLNRILPTSAFITSTSGGTTSANAAWPEAGTYRLIFEGTLASGKAFRKDWDFVAS